MKTVGFSVQVFGLHDLSLRYIFILFWLILINQNKAPLLTNKMLLHKIYTASGFHYTLLC